MVIVKEYLFKNNKFVSKKKRIENCTGCTHLSESGKVCFNTSKMNYSKGFCSGKKNGNS